MARIGNRGLITAALLILSLTGCPRSGALTHVQFTGQPSFGAIYADTRAVTHQCPACGSPAGAEAASCPGRRNDAPCGTRLRRPDRAACGFCRETAICAVCDAFATSGRCRHCGGGGRLEDQVCFNCGGSGRCAACGGSAVCDACGGSKSIPLPWTAGARKEASPPSVAVPSGRQDRHVAWLGEAVAWSATPMAPWTVFRVEPGLRQEIERVTGDPVRFLPRQPGFYLATSGATAVYFDAIDAVVRPGEGAAVDTTPPLRGAKVVRRNAHVEIELPGLPPHRIEPPPVLSVSELRVIPGAGGPVPAGTALLFRAESVPPLPPDAACEWTIASGTGRLARVTRGPVLEHALPAAGRHEVQVRAGTALSAPVEVLAYRVTIVGPAGRPLQECGLSMPSVSAFDPRGRFREDAVADAPDRVRIVVEDPAPGGPRDVTVATRSPEDGPVNPPVRFALSAEGASRTTRAFLLVGDRFDDLADSSSSRDDAAEDPTLHAVPRGRIEVFYRGARSAAAAVGPMILHEIPVRVTVIGPLAASEAEVEKAVDLRLAQVNAVWEPFGRRAARAGLSRMDAPRGLLLIRGRAAGSDAQGRPSRAGATFDGREISTSAAWRNDGGPLTPASAARAMIQAAGEAWKIDLYENMLAGDREAVVLRVRRRDGLPAVLDRLPGSGDAGQSAGPLPVDFTDGCDVAAAARLLSFEEIAVLAGAKSAGPGGIDLFIVPGLRSFQGRPLFKIYPESGFPASLAGSAVVSWEMMDGSGRYPYALARAVGELLLPPGVRPSESDTLFSEPLSEGPGVAGNKRVTAATAEKILRRGRGTR